LCAATPAQDLAPDAPVRWRSHARIPLNKKADCRDKKYILSLPDKYQQIITCCFSYVRCADFCTQYNQKFA
ncbi:MAG: hypothetical protein ACRC4H_14425, partial [Plesiomonas sp.]